MSEAEKRIDDIWVFQFSSNTGNLMVHPTYYIITDQADLENLKVWVKDGVSTICVIANTGNDAWCTGKDFSHISKLKEAGLPNPAPIMLSELSTKGIPMEGSTENVSINGSGQKIEVNVKRMFAKLRVWFEKLPDGMSPKSVEIKSIPNYCKIESIGKDLSEQNAGSYEASVDWVTRAFNADESIKNNETDKNEFVIYVAENLQGESENTFEGKKNENPPLNALVINLWMVYKNPDNGMEEEKRYTLYPGGNTLNNFNIKRNCVYRVKVNINSLNDDVHTPSANCFVVIPGRGLSFEPYYRTEKGGDYNFKDYLDPDDTTGEKVIDKVGIIWQTMDAIGDNTAGDKVWFEIDEDNGTHSKLYVQTNKEGNALVGAYNRDGDVIWSWHIWITANDPGNVGNAINYTTYRWDENGIYPDERQPGYAVMKCNIGALSNSPQETINAQTPNSGYVKNRRTSGMLYQWGRKDPFPPIKRTSSWGIYNPELYDNSHKQIIMTTEGYEYKYGQELFETVKVTDETMVGTTAKSGIKYSIAHPTIFVAAADKLDTSGRTKPSNYINRGDWLPQGDDCLWGGLNQTEDMKSLELIENNLKVHIRDNYGPDKTIFDPCPAGWRVPPGDLWLGFTETGRNAYTSNITDGKKALNILNNYNYSYIYSYNYGMWLCLDGWQSNDLSKYSFFPTQGTRLASGQPFGMQTCGNYHNATVDGETIYKGYENNPIYRLNILHVHLAGNEVFVFPFDYEVWYNVKAIGGPVRCVRDSR